MKILHHSHHGIQGNNQLIHLHMDRVVELVYVCVCVDEMPASVLRVQG